jgi:hypothetical protein
LFAESLCWQTWCVIYYFLYFAEPYWYWTTWNCVDICFHFSRKVPELWLELQHLILLFTSIVWNVLSNRFVPKEVFNADSLLVPRCQCFQIVPLTLLFFAAFDAYCSWHPRCVYSTSDGLNSPSFWGLYWHKWQLPLVLSWALFQIWVVVSTKIRYLSIPEKPLKTYFFEALVPW